MLGKVVEISIADASKAQNSLDKVQQFTILKKYRGLIFAVLFALLLSITNLIIKSLIHYHLVSVSMWRNGALLFPTLIILLVYQFKNGGNKIIFGSVFPINNRENGILFAGLVFCGVFGGVARLANTCAQQFISIGDASIFTSSTPIFVLCFAAICLGESCGFVLVGIALVTFCGVLLISRPPILTGETAFDMTNLAGVGFSLAGVLFSACSTILLRSLRKVHWLLVLLASSTFGFLENFIIAAGFGVAVLPTGVKDSLLTYVAFPIVLISSQLSLQTALKFEKAGPVSLMNSSVMLFSFLLQFVAFGVVPDAYSWGGGAIVAVGLVITTLRKWVEELPSEDDRKRKFEILLL